MRATNHDAVVYPARQTVGRSFDDKLGPARRWLASQVGRSWNKVRSELFDRFDIRTTAGRHIVFDHLLNDVAIDGHSERYWVPHWVDAHGVLRMTRESRSRGGWSRPAPLPEAREIIEAWLAARWVLPRGEHLFWLEPTEAGFFRQAKALSPAESERWLALPQWFRDGKLT
ncbi:MAG: hypothetical protein ABJB12_15665 [Pseudomonadota bacterium]